MPYDDIIEEGENFLERLRDRYAHYGWDSGIVDSFEEILKLLNKIAAETVPVHAPPKRNYYECCGQFDSHHFTCENY